MPPEGPRGPEERLFLPPGFRFCPTDEELVVHYLLKKVAGEGFTLPIIAEVKLYKFDPWELPAKALFGEKEWYFLSPRDRKYPNGSRPNRAAKSGYWKATGVDKSVRTKGGSKQIGIKKSLVFYKGRTTSAVKTNWIMHEYRLDDGGKKPPRTKGDLTLDNWVLCRIYCKTSRSKRKDNKDSTDSGSIKDQNIIDYFPPNDDAEFIERSKLNTPEVCPVKNHEQCERINKKIHVESCNTHDDDKKYPRQYYGHSQTKWNSSKHLNYCDGEICQSGLNSIGHTEDIASRFFTSILKHGVDCAYNEMSMQSCSSRTIDPYMSNHSSIEYLPKNSVEDDQSLFWW